MKTFENWNQLISDLSKLDENELRDSINFEVAVKKRRVFIERMHQRYSRLRADRERALLINGELLL
jgi:hypothetical protein